MLLTYKDDSDGPKTYSRPQLKEKNVDQEDAITMMRNKSQ